MNDPLENALAADAKAASATRVGNVLTASDGTLPVEEKAPPPRVDVMRNFTIDIVINHERFVGEFTNRVLSAGQRSMMGSAAAALAMGQPYESLDPFTREWNEMLAHMNLSLLKRPDWFKDLAGIMYPELVDLVYGEVVKHERMFRGLGGDA